MNFSDRVKALKKEKGMTTEALAAASGVALSTLNKVLSGDGDSIKLSNAVAIADALGCSLEHLATGKAETPAISDAELEHLAKYRVLDTHGVRICDFILQEEYLRCASAPKTSRVEIPESVFRSNAASSKPRMLTIPFYGDRVSAGLGEHLDSTEVTEISVVENDKTKRADFALRVSGNSMEPRYHDGDILLIENKQEINVGELGIFICDGEGYFKQYGGDCLISLNPDYAPIPLSSFDSFSCRGSVIGTLRSRS